MSSQEPRGARSVTGRRHSPLGWLPWVALALIVLITLVVVLIARHVG
jgi:hypothetical protein